MACLALAPRCWLISRRFRTLQWLILLAPTPPILPVLALLLVFQLAGEALSHTFALPVPGPVIGMLGLLLALIVRGWRKGAASAVPPGLDRVTRALLDHLSLLFVPAGVGVTIHMALLAEEAVPIATALVVSTLAAIAVAGLLMARHRSPPNENRDEDGSR
ncbi:putative effector of murein hydrolase LrgA [Thioflavicoccus mobilis 8321]|uniref:Putative effector of murein hydrolase LrgA n=1 Tax=Thioflavicoccus mobilis 8321 TaxID=765912 RepID=L0GWB4_9GAMM|nr:putative effector of murein hydrolase LrgA [Thioflavicoccus mobilis 8321]